MKTGDLLLFLIPAGILIVVLVAMLDHWAGKNSKSTNLQNVQPTGHNLLEWLGATVLVVGSFIYCVKTGRVEKLASIAGPVVGLWLLGWWLYRRRKE